MPDRSNPSGRIIIPGAEQEETSSAPKIVLPPGVESEETRPAPKIVLPPGVSREPAEDVPEYPKLRPLVLMPFSDGKREMILVNDPLGVIPGQPVLGMEALGLLQLLDGTVSITDLAAATMRESKDIRVANMIRDFIAELDKMLMLDSPRFDATYRALREAYHPLEIRPAALEGHSYPADATELRTFLDEQFTAAERMREEAGDPAPAANVLPRALMAPHLDPRRAGPAIARSYLELGTEQTQPLRVVVFGTGHSLVGDTYALTRKHFETPIGKLACDTAFVDAMAQRLGDTAYHGELAHREEHSIELQALFLLHRFRDRPIRIVPILCGGFHALLDRGVLPREDAGFEAMIQAVLDTERTLGGPTVYVASVDFSHVGARFGDPPVTDEMRKEIETQDRAAIETARRGDADAWFQSIADHDDSTRICGFAPTYAMLRCAEPAEGRLLRYEQSDEKEGSLVSVASMVWGAKRS